MHKFKKTVVNASSFLTIEQMKEIANRKLSHSSLSQEEKRGVCDFLEEALIQANQKIKFDYVFWEKQGRSDWLLAGGDDWQRPHFEKGEDEPGMGEYSRIYK